jgi:hypothetical protein
LAPLALLTVLVPSQIDGAHYSPSIPQLDPAIEADLLIPAFNDPLYDGPLILPPVESIEDIEDHLLEMHLPFHLYENAYDDLNPAGSEYRQLSPSDPAPNVYSLDYDLGGQSYKASAFYGSAESDSGRYAALVIPGSGFNQASAIFFNDQDNYHYNISEMVRRNFDLYVYVKPNEDFLAIHRNGKKLLKEYIVFQGVNAGGSYSAKYLVDSMAILKHLKSSYDKVLVLGLSQGGQAALYCALQAEPDGALIASGYSVLNERYFRAGLGQILIPGMMKLHNSEAIYETISASPTRFCFTWGSRESGVYGVDASMGITSEFFAPLDNVECAIHGLGHSFPGWVVERFLDSFVESEPETDKTHGPVLWGNVPNPFTAATRMSFSISAGGHVKLRVFDAAGRVISVLVDKHLDPGSYVESWRGLDTGGRPLPSGTYFYRLEVGDWSSTGKMTLAR